MILIQEDDDDKLHLITFDDKKLYDAELNYPRHKKELLAIKEALTKWCAYIDNGLSVIIIIDHDSLKYMNTIKMSSK